MPGPTLAVHKDELLQAAPLSDYLTNATNEDKAMSSIRNVALNSCRNPATAFMFMECPVKKSKQYSSASNKRLQMKKLAYQRPTLM